MQRSTDLHRGPRPLPAPLSLARLGRDRAQVDALVEFQLSTRRLQRLMVGYASELEIDGNGRVLLPRELREFATLDREVMLIGQGYKFELWADQRWNERRDSWLNGEGGDGRGLPPELETLSL